MVKNISKMKTNHTIIFFVSWFSESSGLYFVLNCITYFSLTLLVKMNYLSIDLIIGT